MTSILREKKIQIYLNLIVVLRQTVVARLSILEWDGVNYTKTVWCKEWELKQFESNTESQID